MNTEFMTADTNLPPCLPLPGAMLGGLLIGIVQSGANTYISSSMSDTFVYLILIVVLMLRPAGILGKNVGEKV